MVLFNPSASLLVKSIVIKMLHDSNYEIFLNTEYSSTFLLKFLCLFYFLDNLDILHIDCLLFLWLTILCPFTCVSNYQVICIFIYLIKFLILKNSDT